MLAGNVIFSQPELENKWQWINIIKQKSAFVTGSLSYTFGESLRLQTMKGCHTTPAMSGLWKHGKVSIMAGVQVSADMDK